MTVVLDIDGTLVDTNYQPAIAWHRALRDHGEAIRDARDRVALARIAGTVVGAG